jgi:hypothetical protein
MLTALWIQTANPKVSSKRSFEYAEVIVRESLKRDINPRLVVAIAWHESGFRTDVISPTADYGLMQVHWYPGSPWLKGLKESDLLNWKINLRSGIHELSWWKRQHEENCDPEAHNYWGHYKWGYRVKNRKYGQAVLKKKDILQHVVGSVKDEV